MCMTLKAQTKNLKIDRDGFNSKCIYYLLGIYSDVIFEL